jgi:hypothetical protein
MEVIRGLSVSSGQVSPQKIYLEVDANKVCYVVQPNGVVLTSTAGKIDVNYTGSGGNVQLIIPKNTDGFQINNSALIGIINLTLTETYFSAISCPFVSKIITKGNDTLIAGGSLMLTNLYCKNKTTVNVNSCSLTAQSIGDFLLDAIANNRTYAGTLIATGGTNAGATAVNSYLITRGTTLAAVRTQLATWTITLNV